MEKKTKYRMIGILVIIAAAIILLPFFSKRDELTAETLAIKAPPFPDQPVQNPVTAPSPQSTPEVPLQQETASIDNKIKLETDDVIRAAHPSVIHHVEVPEINAPILSKEKKGPVKLVDNQSLIKRISLANSHQIKKNNFKLSSSSTKNIIGFKKVSWVVQMGSFKNKANALRLVNQLRASGYHAFLQKMGTTSGENTRVFVGPLNKRTDAHQLAMRLENDLHLRGIILNYKPLIL